MKVFLTGGAGFIGHHVVKELAAKGCELAVYDSFATYFPENLEGYRKNLQLRLAQIRDLAAIIRGDAQDADFLLKAVRDFKPDIVIHLAAIPVASASNRFSREAVQINLNGTVNIIDAVRSVESIRRLVYVSSSYVYGDFQYEPADEKHPLDPMDTYGATKLSGEILVRGIGKRFGIEHTIVRPSAAYGPTGSNGAASQLFVENAIAGKPLKLHDGGAARIDFTYVEDTAHGLTLAALSANGANEIFNVTSGRGRSLKEFAEIVKRHVPDASIVEGPPSERTPNRGSLDISKARRLLGFAPAYSLEDGIGRYVEFVRAHR
jgi:nucleoside-diphosphate-sugar epimerase